MFVHIRVSYLESFLDIFLEDMVAAAAMLSSRGLSRSPFVDCHALGLYILLSSIMWFSLVFSVMLAMWEKKKKNGYT